MKRPLVWSLACVAALHVSPALGASPAPEPAAASEAAVAAGRPLLVYVVVPLCDNALIDCGSPIAGRPGELEHNLYWGAVFGAKRFFSRKNSGWEAVETRAGEGVFLERVIFRRFVAGAPFGAEEPVELLVAFQAVHGEAIDQAVEHYHAVATLGATLAFEDHGVQREEPVVVVGYEGHNRLMDGKRLPPPPAAGSAPLPSFVLACESEGYFAEPMAAAGARPFLTTATRMAPEAYLVDAIVRALGEKASPAQVRDEAVASYAKWQRLSRRDASSVFAPAPSPVQ